ncbi:MAG: DM13 domain-containing protein [Parcubacteria group bacterium]|nr:DM13 domain-containing protein [Parcubacteria group bacterium]
MLTYARKLILAGGIILIATVIYFTGAYTYFIENRISEELPKTTPSSKEQTLQEPKILKQGNFINADLFHKGSGQAYILEYPDGRKVLRFENFETVNGPDLFVYLSETSTPTGNLKSLGNFIDLGRLKGNIGNQNYELTENVSSLNSVVIWCKKFGVLFPYAVLK